MAMAPEAPSPERHAIGLSMKRKEDPRFIRGRGQYVDDIVLPGMLYMALVHSPYPHARINGIDKTAALAMPGVKAVITGEDLVNAGPRLDSDLPRFMTNRWCSP